METISRDNLCAMRGRLLMLACCVGVTITPAMVDEMMVMVEEIDMALSDGEEIHETRQSV